MMLSCRYDVVRVGRKAEAGSIDKGAGPNGPKGRGLRPHLSIIQNSKYDWSELDLGYFLC